MTFIGLSEGTKGYIFMRSPNNIVFTAIQALFDETLFPKCPNMHRPGFTPVGLPPADPQGEYNIPLDDEDEDHGGDLPQVPLPARPVPPQPPAQYYPPLPPSLPSSGVPSPEGKGRALPSSSQSPPLDDDPFGFAPLLDDQDMYMSRPIMPLVPREPTPPVYHEPVTPRHTRQDIPHPLGWRRVSSCERAEAGDDEQFRWVPSHHTPRTFRQERLERDQTSYRAYDPGLIPAYWSPSQSRSLSAPPRQPAVEPLPAPAAMNPPRCAWRIRQPVFRPENVYGNRPPVDILADNDQDPFQGPSLRNPSPGPSGGGSGNNQPSTEGFTLPHIVQPDMTGQHHSQNPNFLVNFSVIFRSLSGPFPAHFLTGQFVCRTFRPDSPVDMTRKINK